MFSLERALIGFAAAVGDSVSRRPAMHVVGSLVAFGLLAVGILLIEVESDVFKLWVRATYLSGEILLFFCRRPSKMMMMCVPFRLVSSNTTTTTTTTTTSACVSLREEASSDATARLGEDGQTERARRCFLAVRAHLFFFFFADADSNRLWERWRRTENVKQIRWREDERVILTYLPTTNFSLSLSLSCVCVLSLLKNKRLTTARTSKNKWTITTTRTGSRASNR